MTGWLIDPVWLFVGIGVVFYLWIVWMGLPKRASRTPRVRIPEARVRK